MPCSLLPLRFILSQLEFVDFVVVTTNITGEYASPSSSSNSPAVLQGQGEDQGHFPISNLLPILDLSTLIKGHYKRISKLNISFS